MRIVICEDEAIYMEPLKRIITQWSVDNNQSVELSTYTDAESLLAEFEKGVKFDLAFLDIQLPGKSGLDLASIIRNLDLRITITFVTSFFERHLAKGYESGGNRFLRKPVKEIDCIEVLNYVCGLKQRYSHGDFVYQVDGETMRVPKSEIMYLEARGHYVDVHFKDKVERIRRKKRDLEQEFGKPMFVNCHRGYIVNLLFVDSIPRESVRMTNGEVLSVSKTNWRDLNQCFLAVYVDNALSAYQT